MREIVVGTDGSAGGEAALRWALDIAKGSGARLHLVTAYPDAPSFRERLVGTARRESIDLREVADNVLARAAEEAGAAGLVTETYAEEGDPAHVLIDVAQQQGADLIVVGARGLTGLERFLLGSVSSKLAHHAPCSVTIVRQR